MKRSFFAFFSCFFIVPVYALIGPVRDIPRGERLWDITSRIGEMLDTETSCDFGITQEDIGDGGIFSITTPGAYYCLTETVTISTDVAITIAASDIVLDLNGHMINGGNNILVSGVSIGASARNVVVKNGTIAHMGISSNGILKTEDGSIIQDILIKDMTFLNIVGDALDFNEFRATTDNLEVDSCHFINSGQVTGIVKSCTMRNCVFDDWQVDTNPSLIFMTGQLAPFPSEFARHIIIEDCILTNSFSVQTVGGGMFVAFAENAIIKNNVVSGAAAGGFSFEMVNSLYVGDCVSQGSGDCTSPGMCAGFFLNPESRFKTAIFERCVAQNGFEHGFHVFVGNSDSIPTIEFRQCVAAQNALGGFFIDYNDSSIVKNVIFRLCTAQANGGPGFAIEGQDDSVGRYFVFDQCIAQENVGDGFVLHNLDTGGTIDNVLFDRCTAIGSLAGGGFEGNGFSLNTVAGSDGLITGVTFQDCVAQANAGDGFDLDTTTTDCKVLTCCAVANSGFGVNDRAVDQNFVLGTVCLRNAAGDFFGISDPASVVSYRLSGGAAGATKWTNIST